MTRTIDLEFAGKKYAVSAVGLEVVAQQLAEMRFGVYGRDPIRDVATDEMCLDRARRLVLSYLHACGKQKYRAEVKWANLSRSAPAVHKIEPARICQMCRWVFLVGLGTPGGHRECRLSPPQRGGRSGLWGWPEVLGSDWCSKWEERES